MSYLNWKETDHALQLRDLSSGNLESLGGSDTSPHSHTQPQLELALEWDTDELASFLESYEALEFLAHQTINEELRMGLSPNWVLFWKLREFGSRALLAHPDQNDWVGTIALTEKDADQWMSRLAGLKVGESLSLRQVLRLEPVTNFNVVVTLKDSPFTCNEG